MISIVPYLLPKATESVLGGVIVGDNIDVDGNGVISVAAYDLPKASASMACFMRFTNLWQQYIQEIVKTCNFGKLGYRPDW